MLSTENSLRPVASPFPIVTSMYIDCTLYTMQCTPSFTTLTASRSNSTVASSRRSTSARLLCQRRRAPDCKIGCSDSESESSEKPKLTCVSCSSPVSYPCWYCIDCPGESLGPTTMHSSDCQIGQIELYTHHPFLPTLVKHLNRQGIRTCAAYLLESQFMEDKYKFFRSVIFAATRSQRTLTRRAPPFQWCALSDVRHGEPGGAMDQPHVEDGPRDNERRGQGERSEWAPYAERYLKVRTRSSVEPPFQVR